MTNGYYASTASANSGQSQSEKPDVKVETGGQKEPVQPSQQDSRSDKKSAQLQADNSNLVAGDSKGVDGLEGQGYKRQNPSVTGEERSPQRQAGTATLFSPDKKAPANLE